VLRTALFGDFDPVGRLGADRKVLRELAIRLNVAGRRDWPARTQDAKLCIEPKGDSRSGGWGLAKLLHGAVSGAGRSLQTCE